MSKDQVEAVAEVLRQPQNQHVLAAQRQKQKPERLNGKF